MNCLTGPARGFAEASATAPFVAAWACRHVRLQTPHPPRLAGRGNGYAKPNSISSAPHSIWPIRMCISWIRAVVSDGTTSK